MFIICGFIIILSSNHVLAIMYPDSLHNAMTCDEFSQHARFNPYSVLSEPWFVFYYWGPSMPRVEFVFQYPSPREKSYLHYILDEHVSIPINWTAKFVVLTNTINNHSSLLVETGDRGQYLEYPFLKVKKGQKIVPVDVRFKQTGDNKYIGYMNCELETVLVMSKKSQIPCKKYIQEAANRIGYRGRGSKSYLYQGHEWMPIPEDDERTYWMTAEDQRTEIAHLDSMLERDQNGNLLY